MKYILILCLCLVSFTVQAEEITYFSDPAFDIENDEDHPLRDLLILAEQNNPRAQFILGDLYSKGKGGVEKDVDKAKELFEKSARQGNRHSFIRLAAISKREKNALEAFKWYTLSLEHFDDFSDRATRNYITKARHDLKKEYKMSRKDVKTAKRRAKNWRSDNIYHKNKNAKPIFKKTKEDESEDVENEQD